MSLFESADEFQVSCEIYRLKVQRIPREHGNDAIRIIFHVNNADPAAHFAALAFQRRLSERIATKMLENSPGDSFDRHLQFMEGTREYRIDFAVTDEQLERFNKFFPEMIADMHTAYGNSLKAQAELLAESGALGKLNPDTPERPPEPNITPTKSAATKPSNIRPGEGGNAPGDPPRGR